MLDLENKVMQSRRSGAFVGKEDDEINHQPNFTTIFNSTELRTDCTPNHRGRLSGGVSYAVKSEQFPCFAGYNVSHN